MGDNRVEYLIEKYYQGSITPEEENSLLDWVREDDAHRQTFVDALRILGAADAHFEKGEAQAWQRISQAIKPVDVAQPRVLRFPALYRWVAVILILIMGASAYFFLDGIPHTPASQEMITLSHPGAVDTFHTRLPDGTLVWLNKGSQLTYAPDFGETARTVNLAGEGFFEVARDSTRPFSVIAHNVRTTALGTSFNIRAFPDGDKVQVALTSGKVAVSLVVSGSGENEQISLIPGEELTYSLKQQHFAKGAFDADERLLWRKGILYFKSADVAKVAELLERWYLVEVEFQGKFPHGSQITATFQNEKLERVLEVINGISADYQCKWDGKRVLIRPKGGN